MKKIVISVIGVLVFLTSHCFATDFNVGPGQAYTTIGAVPWYALSGGDTVYIHHKNTPYYEKFLISTRGTAQNPIRVIGVPDENGNRPIISGNGATTSPNNHFRWQAPDLLQWLGVVFVCPSDNDSDPLPGHIEIKNLQIQDGYNSYNFTAENGTVQAYDGFAAGIYLKSCEQVLIENCILTNCGQGIYNWTGSGSNWWDGLSKNITLRGNYFYNNGQPNSYTEHQTYTESDGVIVENNRYGNMRSGAWGSHLKDRSAGTVIRYNIFETAPAGWVIDLVEPEEAWAALGSSNKYKEVFVYGNIIINNGNYEPNYFHWNEDHQLNQGRATILGGKLFFYYNTVLTIANKSDMTAFYLFNTTWGAYECPGGSPTGVIDIRNNIFAVLPRTQGSDVPDQQFAYCNNQLFNFGVNWVSPGWETNTNGSVTGTVNLFSPADNNPGFENISAENLNLVEGSSARNMGESLASEVSSNYLAMNLTPIYQYILHQQVEARPSINDLGAYEYGSDGGGGGGSGGGNDGGTSGGGGGGGGCFLSIASGEVHDWSFIWSFYLILLCYTLIKDSRKY